MRKLLSLNALFKQYSRGLLEKKQFEGLIFETVLENYRHFHLYDWDKDDYADYLCWLYPRMSRAIDNYREKGASFEAYIKALVRWSAKEYHFRMADHRITEYAAWMIHSTDWMIPPAETAVHVHNSEPEYLSSRSQQNSMITRQQILVLLLKSYHFISDDFLDRVALRLEMKKEKIVELVNKLRELRINREEVIRRLQERIHCQFYRCITFEKRLNAVTENSAHYAKMKSRLERARLRLKTMRKRLAGIRRDPTNRQIAEVLGIPKGTVDSSMYLLRVRIKQEKQNLPERIKKKRGRPPKTDKPSRTT